VFGKSAMSQVMWREV